MTMRLIQFGSTVLTLALFTLLSTSCSRNSTSVGSTTNLVKITNTKSSSAALAAFYFNGLADPPIDAISAGILSVDDNDIGVHVDSLANIDSLIAIDISSLKNGNRIDWDDLENALAEKYYDYRRIPIHLDSLKQRHGFDSHNAYTIVVDGVMTTARRHTHLPLDALESAISGYRSSQSQLIYPEGTLVLGEHIDEANTFETTAMIKRPDGFWDFAVYDASGMLVRETQARPKALAAPLQCTGCHFGRRAYEPEKSFPAAAPLGPDGERQLFTPGFTVPEDLVLHLDEHRRRSDYLLGMYATFHLAEQYGRGDSTQFSAINFRQSH